MKLIFRYDFCWWPSFPDYSPLKRGSTFFCYQTEECKFVVIIPNPSHFLSSNLDSLVSFFSYYHWFQGNFFLSNLKLQSRLFLLRNQKEAVNRTDQGVLKRSLSNQEIEKEGKNVMFGKIWGSGSIRELFTTLSYLRACKVSTPLFAFNITVL